MKKGIDADNLCRVPRCQDNISTDQHLIYFLDIKMLSPTNILMPCGYANTKAKNMIMSGGNLDDCCHGWMENFCL